MSKKNLTNTKLFLLFAFLCLAICSSCSQPSSETVFNRGVQYEEKGMYDAAIKQYSKAIQLDSENFLAYKHRGNAYGLKGDFSKAIDDHTKAIEINPKHASSYYNRGIVYYSSRDFKKAVADYTKALELNPEYSAAYLNRGSAYSEQGNYAQAIDDYTKAIGINPGFAEAYVNRGSVYTTKKDFDKAIADHTKAIELKPSFAEAYFNRGLSYMGKGDYEQASENFDQAAAIKPELEEVSQRIKGAYEQYVKSGKTVSTEHLDGEIPEKGALGRQAIAREVAKVLETDGTGILSRNLLEPDIIVFEFARLNVTAPEGWDKQADVQISSTSKTFLLYNKNKNVMIPAIGITKDTPPPGVETAIDFSLYVKNVMEQSHGEDLFISEPKEVLVNGKTTSYVEMTEKKKGGKTAWYQFMIEGNIVSFQYINYTDQFDVDFPVFKAVVESLNIEK